MCHRHLPNEEIMLSANHSEIHVGFGGAWEANSNLNRRTFVHEEETVAR